MLERENKAEENSNDFFLLDKNFKQINKKRHESLSESMMWQIEQKKNRSYSDPDIERKRFVF